MEYFLSQFDNATFSFAIFNFVQPEEVKPSYSINQTTKFNAKAGVKMLKRRYTTEIQVHMYWQWLSLCCHQHFHCLLGNIHPDTVTWDASLTSQPILSMFCECQNIALKTFSSIYFDTVGWCLSFREIRIYCCAFSHWDCILCISAIVIMQKICPLVFLFQQIRNSASCNYTFLQKKRKKQIITKLIRQVQRRIHNPVKHLRWNFLRKQLTAFPFFHAS